MEFRRVLFRSSDIDVIYLNGYGFPAFRGGPMYYADRVGLNTVLARVRELHARCGDWWKPAPLLEKLAPEGRTFTAWRSKERRVGRACVSTRRSRWSP